MPNQTSKRDAVEDREPVGLPSSDHPGVDGSQHLVSTRWADGLAFLRGFLSRPLDVASVVPSSAFLEARIVAASEVARARYVVELGPGTGGTTRALLRAMRSDARLLAIELNPAFCDRLRQRVADPRLAVQVGSAEELRKQLQRQGLPAPDVVVSGIPFSTLPAAAGRRVAAAIDASLAPGGRLVAYQVRPHLVPLFEPLLGTPEVAWEWRNVPPLRLYRWVRPT